MSVITPVKVTAPEGTLKATKAIKASIDELRVQRAIKTAADKRSKELSAEILAFAGPVGKFIMWGQTRLASIVDSHSTITDLDTLKQAFPEAYAACVSQKPYKQVR